MEETWASVGLSFRIWKLKLSEMTPGALLAAEVLGFDLVTEW